MSTAAVALVLRRLLTVELQTATRADLMPCDECAASSAECDGESGEVVVD